MSDDKLTPMESAILLLLMAEAREISNAELKERWNFTLTGTSRTKLNRLRLVASTKVGRGFAHQLDDKGWVRVRGELDLGGGRGAAVAAALSALHANLRDRVLARAGFHNLGEMFSREGDPASGTNSTAGEPDGTAGEPNGTGTAEQGDVAERVREAYRNLADEPGAWVNLARLRPLLADVARGDLDETLRKLNRASDVNIVPESNQKTLTEAQVDAAVSIGGRDKHLIAIGV